jgi:hypothetical protein
MTVLLQHIRPYKSLVSEFQSEKLRDFNILYTSFSHIKYPWTRHALPPKEMCNKVDMSDSHFFKNSLLIGLINR